MGLFGFERLKFGFERMKVFGFEVGVIIAIFFIFLVVEKLNNMFVINIIFMKE